MTTPVELRALTAGGQISGLDKGGLLAFRGIPYACPPIGDLRFRAPVPMPRWSGVRATTEFGPVPPQPKATIVLTGNRAGRQGEDALTLNVLTASLEPDTRPVVVHFHSGSYVPGSLSVPGYDGDSLVRTGGVVYVGVNHRIGALGWLDLSEFADSDHPFDTNLALRDQVAALEWVRDNIANFGGDPGNVTILGTSKGATSVTSLMCVPAAKDLFHRAIAQSPSPYAVQEPIHSREWARAFVEFLGAEPDDAAEALATATLDELIAAGEKLTAYVPDEIPAAFWTSPVVDDFLPVHPREAFASGAAHPVPLLIGTTKSEGAAFVTPRPSVLPDSTERIDLLFEVTDPSARYRVLPAYPGYPSRRARFQLAGDAVFWIPSVALAADHGAHAPTFVYRYDFTTAALNLVNLAGAHGGEVIPVFGLADTASGRSTAALGSWRDLQSLSNRMQMHWLSFIRTGKPRPDWKPYEASDRVTKVFASTDRLISDPGSNRRRAWTG